MIPVGGHRAMIERLTHGYIVGLPYFLFGTILVLIGISVALQATLTNNKYAGALVGCFLLALVIRFICYWVWADAQLILALNDFPPPPASPRLVSVGNGSPSTPV